MPTLAGECTKAAAVVWDEDTLGLMVETTLTLRGLGHLSKVHFHVPPTPAKNLGLDDPGSTKASAMGDDNFRFFQGD